MELALVLVVKMVAACVLFHKLIHLVLLLLILLLEVLDLVCKVMDLLSR